MAIKSDKKGGNRIIQKKMPIFIVNRETAVLPADDVIFSFISSKLILLFFVSISFGEKKIEIYIFSNI